MAKTILTKFNLIITSLLAVLGFSSCGSSQPLEYGTPFADFTAKGQVLNEANKPLENIQIIVKRGHKDDAEIIYLNWQDTLYTNTAGVYYEYYSEVFPFTYNRVIANDTTGVYASDSIDVNTRYSNGDGHWDYGESTLTADFTLKKNNKEPK
ncbi:MAG: radical SAM-associated putative lipoprotein [Paludibacteraceae bacterium]|nr:radical SAM-associated putative lipoprotein [Paludibacteraceae bacterium]